MKKYLSLILVLAMVLCMAAYGAAPAQATQAGTYTQKWPQCAGVPTQARTYTPGTYTGVGAGKNGDITVEVTFSAEKPRAWVWMPFPAQPIPATVLWTRLPTLSSRQAATWKP